MTRRDAALLIAINTLLSLAMVGGSFCGGKTGWIEKSVRHLQG